MKVIKYNFYYQKEKETTKLRKFFKIHNFFSELSKTGHRAIIKGE